MVHRVMTMGQALRIGNNANTHVPTIPYVKLHVLVMPDVQNFFHKALAVIFAKVQ